MTPEQLQQQAREHAARQAAAEKAQENRLKELNRKRNDLYERRLLNQYLDGLMELY